MKPIQSEIEYKNEYLAGLHQTEYNHCRFAEDKTQFAKDWVLSYCNNVNLENPQNIVDRINWYKIYDKDFRKPIYADKISVLNELHYLNLDDIIIKPVFQTRSYLTEHDFNSLPNGKYIFKCNHGSGWNLKFEKHDNCNPTYLLNKLKEWYSLNYAYICGYEWQYEKIIPGVIVQPDIGDFLCDWHFYCENGNIEAIQISRKLSKNIEECIAWCDENGNDINWFIGIKPYQFKASKLQKSIIEKMKPIVKILAQDFKFVRVDLYYVNDKIYFGELTFTPCSGKLDFNKL